MSKEIGKAILKVLLGIVTLGAGYQLLEKGKSDWKNR